MDGLEEKLGSLLSDPTAMDKLRQLAGALSGGMPDLGPGFGSSPEPEGPGGLFGGGEGKLTELLGKVMGAYGAPSEAAKLVAALGPWLQPERRERLEKALRVARFVRAARSVLPAGHGPAGARVPRLGRTGCITAISGPTGSRRNPARRFRRLPRRSPAD